MATIHKVETGEYVSSLSPLMLIPDNENGEALELIEAEAQAHADSLTASEGASFKIGRPGDRQVKSQ